MKSAPFASGITLEVPVEHSHRAKAKSLDGLQPFGSEIERIAGITDENITTEYVSVTVASLLKKLSGMFERGQVIRCVVSEENLLRLDLLEEFNVPRFEKFSLNAAPEIWSILLTFEHIENSANVFLGAT